jgi:mono/diheme cytochrome c family protein
MTIWRILICILFATSVHAALPVGPNSGMEVAEWRSDWRNPDGLRRKTAISAAAGTEQRSRLVRHRTYMIEGVPQDYQGVASPIERSQRAILAGAALYAMHCAACHGDKGRGRGDAGLTLKPSPALKTYISRRPWAADEYLLWSVAEGGVEFGSTMPAFRDQLTRREMWEIIAYMRAGFPKAEANR